jgi:tRNA-uridine 2-sulfurtransferase
VLGATMKTFCYGTTPAHANTCCGLEGIMDARRVADHLGIPHYVFDMEESFGEAVIDDFVSEYVAGRTPNPCVRCNSNTKIPDLLAPRSGPGRRLHRHRPLCPDPSRRRRPRAAAWPRPAKDQSYFLWGVPPEVLDADALPRGR